MWPTPLSVRISSEDPVRFEATSQLHRDQYLDEARMTASGAKRSFIARWSPGSNRKRQRVSHTMIPVERIWSTSVAE